MINLIIREYKDNLGSGDDCKFFDIDKTPDHIYFREPKSNYKESLLKSINPKNKFTFFMDENMKLLNKIPTDDILKEFVNDDILCFSYSLYKDIPVSINYDAPNKLIPSKETDQFVFWNWSKHYFDYGNPFVLFSGMLFRTQEITKMLSKIKFNNYDELVESLQIFQEYPKEMMFSPVTNCLLSDQ